MCKVGLHTPTAAYHARSLLPTTKTQSSIVAPTTAEDALRRACNRARLTLPLALLPDNRRQRERRDACAATQQTEGRSETDQGQQAARTAGPWSGIGDWVTLEKRDVPYALFIVRVLYVRSILR
ncbi:hypothetical protein NDU88_003212 [Pleurodeles waltl]|uniref:Uncharacterized protein n=1 Tax=Pleurodeles waltl TaxID=8319 RepID=A0AAV7SDW6_PLEWA|nr:hypothetical protein NDU88_003212 [Pleurodeles waltl]